MHPIADVQLAKCQYGDKLLIDCMLANKPFWTDENQKGPFSFGYNSLLMELPSGNFKSKDTMSSYAYCMENCICIYYVYAL